MIENFKGTNGNIWIGSIGDGEAIANKLDEMRKAMPDDTLFTLQDTKSTGEMITFCECKGAIMGISSVIIGGLLYVTARYLIHRTKAKQQKKTEADQKEG